MSLKSDLKCNVRCVESDENIVISFKYGFNESNERLFNFKRNKNEELKQTLARIGLNINNIITKKLKRKNKGKDSPQVANVANVANVAQLLIDGKNADQELKNYEVWKKGAILKVGENLYSVLVNCPTVKSVRLPKSIMAGFQVYPIVSLEFCSSKDCQYIWFKQSLHKENITQVSKQDSHESEAQPEEPTIDSWIKVWEGFYYNTNNDDIGRKLKLICIPNNGFESEAISTNAVNASPGLCPFEERHLLCRDISEYPLGSFRMVSYNILADIYADSEYSRTELFPYCPPYALHIDYRKQLLIKEITGYNADIYCLQEVDKEVFENDLNPIMSSSNCNGVHYNSAFSEKGQVGEGLAAFYNSSKFQLLNSQTISISEELKQNPIFAELLCNVSTNQKLLERLLARQSVFQCILLKSLQNTQQSILLGNTHLYFHPDADHIRLLQSYIYVKFMENYLKQSEKARPHLKISPVLCGDFNSCPEFGVYELMTTGFVDPHIQDYKSNIEETIEGFAMSHSLSLGSACGRPPYTNFTTGFNGCLDYIYYDTNNLLVSQVVPFPSHEQVIKNTAIPSIVFPSDHLALVCTLQWKTGHNL